MSTSENTDPGRVRTRAEQVFGIRMTLPTDDPMTELLGGDTEMFRWYASEQERDDAFEEMRREHLYSRMGDRPTLIYEKVVREHPGAYTRGPGMR